MTPSPELIAARRQALIGRADAVATPGRLQLRDAGGSVLVDIVLADPCGTVDATGVALADTEYAQIGASGDVTSARLVDGDGVWVGEFTTGLATDEPLPELPLPALTFYAGAFVRLVGAHIDCD